MSDTAKMVYRVKGDNRSFTADSFVNFVANLGYGTRNLASAGDYQLTPISRNHNKLEMMYRGSWLVRQIIDSVAEDMTRAGIVLQTDMDPEQEGLLMEYWRNLQIWPAIQSAMKWGRLYGGALAVMMIDGQDPSTPLNPRSIGQGQFKGLLVVDRWMVNPDLQNTVRELGPDRGLPMFYTTINDQHGVPNERFHHSRCIRFEGAELPYWQKIAENMWSLSVIEPMFDRMVAFDSTTNGAAQLVYKAHLRTLSIENLRQIIAQGGSAQRALMEQIGMIRLLQSNEGLTLLDASDKFEAHQYAFGGLSDVLVQFGQQLSGAAQIPLVRLFGQSPAGMNATGESDLRNYYDMIAAQQEAKLRRPLQILLEVAHRSRFGGADLPGGFNFTFAPLWQLEPSEKSQVASTIAQTIMSVHEGGLISDQTALKELRESSHVTGIFTNITDEDINAANDEVPDPQQEGMPGMPGMPGSAPQSGSAIPGAMEGAVPPKAIQGPQERATGAASPPVGQPAAGKPAPAQQPRKRKAPLHPLDTVIRTAQQRRKALHVRRILSRDRNSIEDFQGLQCVIETAKGERREGPGWSVVMPCDYGYITGTSSPEGLREQMDCFIGPHRASERVFVIHQHFLDGSFDEYKVMLGFDTAEEAMAAYDAAFNDGSGYIRAKRVEEKTFGQLKRWLQVWRYGLPPPLHINGVSITTH